MLIDADPALLFTLRGVNPQQLLQNTPAPVADVDAASLSATFGINLDVD